MITRIDMRLTGEDGHVTVVTATGISAFEMFRAQRNLSSIEDTEYKPTGELTLTVTASHASFAAG